MLWAPRFAVPGHIVAAGQVSGTEIGAGEVVGQDGNGR
jgi:hypothetical protein